METIICVRRFQTKPAPEVISTALGEFSEKHSRRLHSYTIAENNWVLAAQFPLPRQHGNKRPYQCGGLHSDHPLSARKGKSVAEASCDRRASSSRTKGSAWRMASAPAET